MSVIELKRQALKEELLEAKLSAEWFIEMMRKNLEIQLEELRGAPLEFPEISVLGGLEFMGNTLNALGRYESLRKQFTLEGKE